MPRVKRSVPARKRRRRILKQAKGFSGSRHRLFRTAREAVLRRVCEFLEVDPGYGFEDPGPRNSSTDYRRRLLLGR